MEAGEKTKAKIGKFVSSVGDSIKKQIDNVKSQVDNMVKQIDNAFSPKLAIVGGIEVDINSFDNALKNIDVAQAKTPTQINYIKAMQEVNAKPDVDVNVDVSESVPKMDRYGMLKNDKTTHGQAHHVNQNAVYKDVIPSDEAIAVKLEGNAFTQPGTPHYETHFNMEKFWDQFRRGGTRYRERPTNLEYTNAMYKALKESGLSESQAKEVIQQAIKQRIEYGLLGGDLVPRIPGRINQVGR